MKHLEYYVLAFALVAFTAYQLRKQFGIFSNFKVHSIFSDTYNENVHDIILLFAWWTPQIKGFPITRENLFAEGLASAEKEDMMLLLETKQPILKGFSVSSEVEPGVVWTIHFNGNTKAYRTLEKNGTKLPQGRYDLIATIDQSVAKTKNPRVRLEPVTV